MRRSLNPRFLIWITAISLAAALYMLHHWLGVIMFGVAPLALFTTAEWQERIPASRNPAWAALEILLLVMFVLALVVSAAVGWTKTSNDWFDSLDPWIRISCVVVVWALLVAAGFRRFAVERAT
jgi:hypothetical protein